MAFCKAPNGNSMFPVAQAKHWSHPWLLLSLPVHQQIRSSTFQICQTTAHLRSEPSKGFLSHWVEVKVLAVALRHYVMEFPHCPSELFSPCSSPPKHSSQTTSLLFLKPTRHSRTKALAFLFFACNILPQIASRLTPFFSDFTHISSFKKAFHALPN